MQKTKTHWIVKLILGIAVFGLILFLTVRYGPEVTKLVTNPHQFRETILSFGPWSGAAFIAFQILQVIIAVIPGEPVQIAGGYLFGAVLGTFYTFAGVLIGYIIVFVMVKFFGFPLVKRLVPANELEKFHSLIKQPKFEITVFILFLIPGIPKDMLMYIAGLAPVKPAGFFLIVMTARLPAMIGSSMESGNYMLVVIISVAASVLFLTGFLLKDKIIEAVHNRLHPSDHLKTPDDPDKQTRP